jgi:hypothetical protein
MKNRFFIFLLLCIETIQLQAINWFISRNKTSDAVLALFLKKYAPHADIIKHLGEQTFGCNEKLPDYFLKGNDTDRLTNNLPEFELNHELTCTLGSQFE